MGHTMSLSHTLDEFCLKNNRKQNSQGKEGKRMNGKGERWIELVEEEFYSRHFYKSLEDMEEGLRTYVEYYNKFRPHMGLHGLTPY